MGEYNKFVCDNSGWTYISEDDIFMIGKNHEVNVAPLLFSTSNIMQYQPVTGDYGEFYCYNCGKIVKEFTINKIWEMDGFEEDEIFKYIENYDDSLKIINFDDKLQKCLTCGKNLNLKEDRIKYFVLKEDGEFEILNKIYLMPVKWHLERENIKYKFLGKYHGYFCRDCRKQINKFIIIENPYNLTENKIKDILNNHTFEISVYLEKFLNSCPECGNELIYLNESSKCPKCGEGKLRLEDSILMD